MHTHTLTLTNTTHTQITHQGLGLDYSSLPLFVDTRHKRHAANANASPDANQCVCVSKCVSVLRAGEE